MEFPKTFGNAKTEARAVAHALKNWQSITYRQAGEAGIVLFQFYALFTIGEMYGRGNVVGYPVGGPSPYHDKVHADH